MYFQVSDGEFSWSFGPRFDYLDWDTGSGYPGSVIPETLDIRCNTLGAGNQFSNTFPTLAGTLVCPPSFSWTGNLPATYGDGRDPIVSGTVTITEL